LIENALKEYRLGAENVETGRKASSLMPSAEEGKLRKWRKSLWIKGTAASINKGGRTERDGRKS